MQNSGFEDKYFRAIESTSLIGSMLKKGRPLVMAIMNTTPDSFYSGSRVSEQQHVLQRVKDLLNDGADIIDIGGYSTRPGAKDISIQEEIDRTSGIIQLINGEFDTVISIDTFRSAVAQEALMNGAKIVNDVSGFSQDDKIIDVVKEFDADYILMHMRGTPSTMQSLTDYVDIVEDILTYFKTKIDLIKQRGVEKVTIDPGFGFAKTIDQNHHLLQHFDRFHEIGLPVLAGLSRKSMIYKKLNITPEEALPGTIALNSVALSKGAHILRVHDVKEAKNLVNLMH